MVQGVPQMRWTLNGHSTHRQYTSKSSLRHRQCWRCRMMNCWRRLWALWMLGEISIWPRFCFCAAVGFSVRAIHEGIVHIQLSQRKQHLRVSKKFISMQYVWFVLLRKTEPKLQLSTSACICFWIVSQFGFLYSDLELSILRDMLAVTVVPSIRRFHCVLLREWDLKPGERQRHFLQGWKIGRYFPVAFGWFCLKVGWNKMNLAPQHSPSPWPVT